MNRILQLRKPGGLLLPEPEGEAWYRSPGYPLLASERLNVSAYIPFAYELDYRKNGSSVLTLNRQRKVVYTDWCPVSYVLAQVRLEPELLVMDKNTSSEYTAEILENKVALLINIDGKNGLSLATALASHGADVALVIYSENLEQTTKVKKQIEMMGRRCLIIRQEKNGDATFSREVVRRTLDEYGRFDIFIDHSCLPEQKLPGKNQTSAEQKTDADYRTQFSATIDTMAIILNHMVPNQINN